MRTVITFLLAFSLTGTVHAQQPSSSLASLVTHLEQQEGPLPELPRKEAKRTLPQLRQRYQRGLQAGTTCYLTANVLNESATPEPLVVEVAAWQAGQVTGRIVRLSPEGRTIAGALVTFEETVILDWLLLRPNGTEEGNYVGKYLDLEERLAALSIK
ncbi:hypothetical protein [Hymenobacter wooponensis]|uniref:DUF2314 domain-containing protein n=1 Tax=Hymenobacter wooponensis TaxID=1525360 RepID=A0A4Z0MQY9_9BACT|nr:hypothetical protein [Hymenobacter wooponensis]TGD81768.1 hypothetical protein EU557_09545 [Hymenobacter wooponensis]